MPAKRAWTVAAELAPRMASRLTTRADKTSTCGSAAPDERDHRQERVDGLAQIAAQCGNVAQVAAQLAEQLAAYWPPLAAEL